MKRWTCPILLVLVMAVIFFLSAQPADESEITSSPFSHAAARLLLYDYEILAPSTQDSVAEALIFLVRKAAHFSEYTLLGFLWYIYLRKKRWNVLISFGATAFYAMTDEFHQLFVPGRFGSIGDVLLDSSGGLFGILTAYVVLCFIYCIRNKDVVEKGVWK